MRATLLAAALAAALLATPMLAPATPLPPTPADTDGDGFPDAVERALGTNPYDPADTPLDVGLNALMNPGFELQAQPAAQDVTCPVFGDQAIDLAGLVIVSPCYTSLLNSPGWNNGQTRHDQSAAQMVDVDGDGDLEMAVPADDFTAHSFYQPYVSTQQAFSADFRALTFDLEMDHASAASIPRYSTIVLSVSTTPFNQLTPWVPFYVDCYLAFPASALQQKAALTPTPGPAGKTYLHVSIAPLQGTFGSYWSGCNALAKQYNAGSNADKHAILQSVRLVQTSFWGWSGTVIDNVDMRGSMPASGVPGLGL